MAGKPQRSRAKADVSLNVEQPACERVLPLASRRGDMPRMSTSRLFEAILLLARDEYATNTNRDLVAELCLEKARQIEERALSRTRDVKRRLHLTIDWAALEFLDMLVARDREIFSSRGEAMTLILRLLGERLTAPEKTAWMRRRLEEILLKYPVRY